MKALPEDIVLCCILPRLPSRSLIRFRCVSKSWHSFITDPNFINNHLSHRSSSSSSSLLLTLTIRLINPPVTIADDVSCAVIRENDWKEEKSSKLEFPFFGELNQSLYFLILGSINGLVCLVCNRSLYLWNPSIRILKTLPPQSNDGQFYNFGFGFGFDPFTNDYKVVLIEYLKVTMQVYVYTLSTDSWKYIASVEGWAREYLTWGRSTYLNGFIYWLVKPLFRESRIISFNIGNQQFQETMLPNYQSDLAQNGDNDDDVKCTIHVVKDSISLLVAPGGKNGGARLHCYIWVLKKEYVVNGGQYSWSWSKQGRFVFPEGMRLTPLRLNFNGEILLLSSDRMLIVYDPGNNKYTQTQTYLKTPCYGVHLTDSLVLL